MTGTEPKKLRSRFYLDEIARWALVLFFFLAFTVYYFADEPDEITPNVFYWLSLARDITLVVALLSLSIGNFLRVKGSKLHYQLRWVWPILAVIFAIFWLFKGSSWVSPELA